MFERKDEIRDVEPRNVCRESTSSSKMREEFSSLNVFEKKVKVLFVLKSAEAVIRNLSGHIATDDHKEYAQIDDERMLNECESTPF